MIITVFGATGRVGKYIVNMGLAQGHTVRAFGRNVDGLIDKDMADENFEAIKGYVFDEADVLKAVHGADAVLSALGGARDGSDKTRSLGVKNIIEQMQKAAVKRLIVLGGMGSLAHDEYGLIMNKPDYPQVFLPVSKEHLQAYNYLHQSTLDWTFIGAPDIPDAPADNDYTVSADYPPATGINKIYAGNIADFMLKEMKENRYLHQRVGISNLN
ncbi:NAD(P)H-binding protein [Panacibacter sp. DH6]|uniref:NAD(P)H-binding protein n=1 Tax=Panacibacter microcysteis TaxID=2793269 RepID=A0A931E177_9BACT|nr:NAD(P)H-binding protein [Panacibacter microcysteis]MBG9376747.1 NAD(P)H-binding protein [Panacibacter microcysteis]